MISIITGIYNQLSVNEIFYESLLKHTTLPFELIIIDNNSTDGSHEFFASKPNVKVIRTGGNYNYPYCQNLGIQHAQYDYLCFFNNDIILTPHWDTRIVEMYAREPRLKVLSLASTDRVENNAEQKKISRRWKRIKYPIQYLGGNTKRALKLMVKLMYKNLDKFAEKRFAKWQYQTIETFSGCVIVFRKQDLDVVGLWDERIQGADFDLCFRMKELSLKDSSVLPVQLALGVYIHHFQRLTVKLKYPPFTNKEGMITLEDKWGEEKSQEYFSYIDGA